MQFWHFMHLNSLSSAYPFSHPKLIVYVIVSISRELLFVLYRYSYVSVDATLNMAESIFKILSLHYKLKPQLFGFKTQSLQKMISYNYSECC